jgi:hypothetical protein
MSLIRSCIFTQELSDPISNKHLYPMKLFDMVGRFKATDAGRLRAEYNRLVEGLAQRGNLPCMWIALTLIFHSQDPRYIYIYIYIFDNVLSCLEMDFLSLCSHGHLAL